MSRRAGTLVPSMSGMSLPNCFLARAQIRFPAVSGTGKTPNLPKVIAWPKVEMWSVSPGLEGGTPDTPAQLCLPTPAPP